MINRRFGKLVVLEKLRSHPSVTKDAYYRCRCDCGTICEARGANLKKGHKKSCGCLVPAATTSPWVGKKVGHLLVLERLPGKKYRCLCDCGQEIVSTSMWSRNKTGTTNCRGPAHRAAPKEKPVRMPKPRMKDHPLHGIWKAMNSRCSNPRTKDFKHYGGRGIQVWGEWRISFWAYAAYVALLEHPGGHDTIDRANNDAGYFPGNLRWATRGMQTHNRRLTHPNRPATVLPMPTKFCPRCDTDRPLEDFPVNNARADGRGGWCRLCMRQATKKWKAEHPEINRLHAKIYHANKRLAAMEPGND